MIGKVIYALIRSINSSSFKSRLILLVGGTALGQAVVVFTLPFLTRTYSPELMGQFSLYTTFLSITSVGLSLLYETAIVAVKDDDDAAYLSIISVFFSVITVPIITSLFYGLILFKVSGFEHLPLVNVAYLFISLILVLIFNVFKYGLMRSQEFSELSQSIAIQNISRVIFQVFMGSFPNLTTHGLVLGDVTGRLMFAPSGYKRIFSSFNFIHSFNLRKAISIMHRYAEFPFFALPSSLINNLALYISVPLIIALNGEKSGGYFILAQRVLTLPMNLIGNSFADVFHSKIAESVREYPNDIRYLFWKSVRNLFVFAVIPITFIATCSPFLFSIIFGKDWVVSGYLVPIMAPSILISFVVSSVSRIITVLEKFRWKLVFDITSLGGQLVVFSVAKELNFSLRETVMCYSFSNALAYSVYFLIISKAVSDYTKSCLPS